MTLDLPEIWRSALAGYAAQVQTIGESGASVVRLTADHLPTLFLKSEPATPLSELRGEATRLMWLRAQAIPCPAVYGTAEHAGQYWLLMSAIDGRDLASSPDLSTESKVSLSAEALAQLHRLDWRNCPFDHCAARRVELVRQRVAAGTVDRNRLEEPRDPSALFARLTANIPVSEDLVVAHGDACYPNFMADGGRFTGFIDCGRLGVADRWQDLALALRSLAFNFGPGHEAEFLAAYGATADPARQAWYGLLDQFF